MKKFKNFTLLLISVLCLFAVFAFGGCKESDGNYVNNSFTYNIDTYIYNDVIEGKFRVNLPQKGQYTVDYTVTAKGSAGTKSISRSKSLDITESGEQSIEISISFSKISNTSYSTAELSDVIITRTKVEDDYTPYAIGFGTTAGVLLVGAVVVFVLDKTGVFKKRK